MSNNAWSISYQLPVGAAGIENFYGQSISPLVTDQISGAIPTNDWWSSLVMPFFDDPYSAPLHAHPLALQAESGGLNLGYTSQATIIQSATDTSVKYEYPYHADLKVGLDGLSAPATKVADYSDWAVTAEWAQADSADKLQATFGHGLPYVYFEKSGEQDVVVNLVEFTGSAIGQPNQTVETVLLEGLNGQYDGGEFGFNLLVNALGEDGSEVANGVQARVSVDSNGDGQFDYVQTYDFLPLDAATGSSELYTQEESRGSGAAVTGELGDLDNGTIKFEVWQPFGTGQIEVLGQEQSELYLPFDDLSNAEGEPISATVNLLSDPTTILGEQFDTVWYQSGNVLGVTMNGSHYGLFAPTGSEWQFDDEFTIRSDLAGKDYFSIAVLPDNTLETLALFEAHAFAFVKDTTVSYAYDKGNAVLETNFQVTTELKEVGFSDSPLLTLYRHQWLNTEAELSSHSYVSARGEMKLIDAHEFVTSYDYTGILPVLPNVMGEAKLQELYAHINETYQGLLAKQTVITAEDTYWVGKDLNELSELVKISDQVGHEEARNYFLNVMKAELADWFDSTGAADDKQFAYNDEWGVLQGYPASFESDKQVNDHHFHYGYFVEAAATIAQFDPGWAEQVSGIVELIIKDVANDDRADAAYPFLRSFDPYAGHFWASGHGAFFAGNNQESSSEAMNFASAVISWGAATDDDSLIELGVYLYTTQLETIKQYWFDVDDAVFPSTFTHNAAGMVWGDGAAYATFFSGEAEMIHGINFLPFNGASLYLGEKSDYVQQNYQALVEHNQGAENDWVDVIWQFQALSDPEAALQKFSQSSGYNGESGESYPHTFHWLNNLVVLGQVDVSVTADVLYYKVFNNEGLLTYTAYNPTAEVIIVHFSDGAELILNPREFVAMNDNLTWSSVSGVVISDDGNQTPVDESNDPAPDDGVDEQQEVADPVDEDLEPEPGSSDEIMHIGTDAGEVLHGGIDNDVIDARGGDDTLHGNLGSDVLRAGAGDDSLYGNAGDDILEGGLGNDFLVGGDGRDTYVYSQLSDSNINGMDRIEYFETGKDKFDVSSLELIYSDLYIDQVNGFTQIHSLRNEFALEIVVPYQLVETDFIFTADSLPDLVDGAQPDDSGSSEQESDQQQDTDDEVDNATQTGSLGNDVLHGGSSDDVLVGLAGSDVLHGNGANDELHGKEGNDSLYGNAGNDVLTGGLGKDFMVGGQGGDVYKYTSLLDSTVVAIDRIETFEQGSDQFDFSQLNLTFNDLYIEKVNGFTWIQSHSTEFAIEIVLPYQLNVNDFIFSTAAVDEPVADEIEENPVEEPVEEVAQPVNAITGDDGNNVLYGTLDSDLLVGLVGDDVLHGHEGDDELLGGLGDDQLHANSGDDLLYGNEGNDFLFGNAGNDVIYGGAGNDSLYGDIGDDRLYGGAAADFLFGGEGADTYVYLDEQDSTAANKDVIEGFDSGVDKLDFTALNTQASEIEILSPHAGSVTLSLVNSNLAIQFVATDEVSVNDILF